MNELRLNWTYVEARCLQVVAAVAIELTLEHVTHVANLHWG